MRLWHQALIPHLPRQQLLGQHRECCALRGLGWGKPHATVNYVFEHDQVKLYQYHIKVMMEMNKRGYKTDTKWWRYSYRGQKIPSEYQRESDPWTLEEAILLKETIYPEHNDQYLKECLENLAGKGIVLEDIV